jgi:hypothetical protein
VLQQPGKQHSQSAAFKRLGKSGHSYLKGGPVCVRGLGRLGGDIRIKNGTGSCHRFSKLATRATLEEIFISTEITDY